MGFWTGIKNRANITPSNLTLLIHPHRSEAEDSPEIAAGGGGNGTETSDASRTHRSPTVTAECSARVRGLSTGERMRRLAEVRFICVAVCDSSSSDACVRVLSLHQQRLVLMAGNKQCGHVHTLTCVLCISLGLLLLLYIAMQTHPPDRTQNGTPDELRSRTTDGETGRGFRPDRCLDRPGRREDHG